MRISDISFVGWLHSIACIVALFTGGYVLSARKGTRTHRRLGYWYIGAMAVLNLTVMVIYRFDMLPGAKLRMGPNLFGIFHWEAVITLFVVLLATYAASRQRRKTWAHIHVQAMLLSYYGLIGGFINEAFVRIVPLRQFALTHGPHAANIAFTSTVGAVQGAALLAYYGLIIYFAVSISRDKRWRISSAATLESRIARNVTA